jgi:RNA polymerase sigma factor (TIGR02999 family)
MTMRTDKKDNQDKDDQDVTGLLLKWRQGDKTALDALIPLVYRELRGVAGARLRGERAGCSLQTTALVHETYLRLVDLHRLTVENRTHFFAIAARLMRQILVDQARRSQAEKRGGGLTMVTIEAASPASAPNIVDVLALDQALEELASMDERPSGFSLLEPLNDEWELVQGGTVAIADRGTVALDFAIVARVNPAGWLRRGPHDPRGIPPGQPATRGSGIRFCVSGPFPDTLPDLSDPSKTVVTTIEGIINGVVVSFQRLEPHGPSRDVGIWENPQRAVPLYPE